VAAGQNGQATIDEAALKTALAGITDAAGNVFSYSANIANIDATALPVIDTTLASISGLSLRDDTGSADFVTTVAAQSISATLSTQLQSGDVLLGSLDNGATWTDLSSFVSGTSLNWTGLTLSGTNTLQLKTQDTAGNVNLVTQAYTVVSSDAILFSSALDDNGTNTLSIAPGTKYRYVLLKVDQTSASYAGMAELQIYSNGVNLARSASSVVTSNLGWIGSTTTDIGNTGAESLSKLTDGTAGTVWTSLSSAAKSGYVMVDLGSAQQIDYITLSGADGKTLGHTLWVSNSDVSTYTLSQLTAAASTSNPRVVQVFTSMPNFNNTTALTNYVVNTDDTTPTFYGTVSVPLTTGYSLKIFNGTTDITTTGGTLSFTDTTNWTFTGNATTFASGTTPSITARVVDSNGFAISQSAATYVFKISPIVLDLNHDGQLAYTQVLMDVTGAGVLSNVSWAAPSDGVLVWNKYGDGTIHDKTQYAFGDPSKGVGDLQGLANKFDANHDGVFNASDAQFSQFQVWQDKNSDGLVQTGEMQSLGDLGLSSLNLTSDGVKTTPSAGVEEIGKTTAAMTNGQSMRVADATFSYTKAVVLHGVEGSQDTFSITETLSQIKVFDSGSGTDGDVIDLSGLLGQLHATNGHLANYVQTVQRGQDTVIQVDATGHHDFANASNQVVLMNTTMTLNQLQQQHHLVI
jgi:hypothetical protein